MQKVLITGANGLLGQKLVSLYTQDANTTLVATARGANRLPISDLYTYISMDITQKEEVMRVITEEKPDVVIHTAAMTNVDQCEVEKEACWAQNVYAVSYLAEACQTVDAFLVHVSTDFIFDGADGPYKEEATANPLSFYGWSKLAAEHILLHSSVRWSIARTVLVYGIAHDMSRSNIILWVKKSLEEGKTIPLKFQGKYVVVPRPNSANISADKMNVVYRGLPNPMTISFAGIGDNFVNASAPGLSKAGGNGKYVLTPQSGTEVTVSVSGKMTDGKTVTDKKVFRIKNIPAPAGAIGGVVGVQKGAKSRLEVSTISADLQDFVYDLKYEVTRFSFKVPGQPAIIVSGNKVDQKCRAALARATKGDQISIFDIKTKIVGASGIIPKDASPVIYEIQ